MTVNEKTQCLLFDFVPERSNSSRYQPQISLQLLDLGHGPSRLDTDRATPNPMTFRNVYRINSYADLADLEAFFEARQGLNESFCLPSWQSDIQLAADAAAGTDYLSVQSHEASLYEGQNLFVYQAGRYFVRTVSAFSDGAIELNSGIPFPLSAGDGISIVYRVTFASDTLSLEHRTNETVEIEIAFVEEIRVADQVGEVTDADTELDALCYLTLSEAEYLLLEGTDLALLTTNCSAGALGDGDGITTVFESTTETNR
jgi:hypothetical protein